MIRESLLREADISLPRNRYVNSLICFLLGLYRKRIRATDCSTQHFGADIGAGDQEHRVAAALEFCMKQSGGGGGTSGLGDDVLVQGKMTNRGEHLVVSDENDFVDEFADRAHVIGFGDARRETVGDGVACFGGGGLAVLPGEEVGGCLLGLHTDDANGWRQVLGSGGNSPDERRVTHRDDNGIDGGKLLENLERNGSRSSGQIRIGGIVQEVEALGSRTSCSLLESRAEIGGAFFDDLRAEGRNAGALHRIGIGRKKDRGLDPKELRGKGDRGAMVAGAGSCDLVDRASRGVEGESIERASRFERSGGQVAFDLQINIAAGFRAQGRSGYQSRHREIAS